jgi:hypothetical protein
MRRQVVEIETLHERASATPDRQGPRPRPVGGPTLSRSAIAERAEDDASLRGRQLRFAHGLMTPESSPGTIDDAIAAKWLTSGPRLTALERFEIYRRGYHARLIECVADDYPATQHALGEAVFDDLCRAYIVRFPSAGPSLNYFSRHMSAFIREGVADPFPMRAFAVDLTSLEWAIVEVIHAASEPPLALEGLRGVPDDGWGAVRLEPTPAFRLLRFHHPVNEYFRAFRNDESPAIPPPAPSATVVYRSGPTVWRMDLSEPMTEVLSALVGGEPLGGALARAEALMSDDAAQAEITERVTTWFREWVGHGLFVRARW